MDTFRVAFSPERDTLSNVRHSLAGWARGCGLSEHAVADVVVAAGEAIENALEHGRDRFFVIEGLCDNRVLEVAVHDKGGGFDAAGKGNPVPPELLGQRGLGIYLMRALTDEARFHWRDDGMTVTLKKNITVPDVR